MSIILLCKPWEENEELTVLIPLLTWYICYWRTNIPFNWRRCTHLKQQDNHSWKTLNHFSHHRLPLREEILAGRNFGGFGGFVKNPPKSAKLTFFAIRQIKFPPKLLFFAMRQIFFWFSSIIFFHISYSQLSLFPTSRNFEQKSQKHEKKRMRDKNSSLFILLLKLVNFNNTFARLLYFFFCQDTSGKMFPSIRQNKFPPNYVTFAIRQNFFPPKFLLLVCAQT